MCVLQVRWKPGRPGNHNDPGSEGALRVPASRPHRGHGYALPRPQPGTVRNTLQGLQDPRVIGLLLKDICRPIGFGRNLLETKMHLFYVRSFFKVQKKSIDPVAYSVGTYGFSETINQMNRHCVAEG